MNKIKKIILYTLLGIILVFCWWKFIYMSLDNTIRRSMDKEISEWYYSGISIEKNLKESRPTQEKESMIGAMKIIYELNDDWYFFSENLSRKYIDNVSAILDYELVFRNKKNADEYFFQRDRYYYDFDQASVVPIPILKVSNFYESEKKDNLKKIKTLWGGDFDDYLKYYQYK